MARIEITVTMKGIYSYERPAYGYGIETAYIYNMETEDGKAYVWKTTSFMTLRVESDKKNGMEYEEKTGKWFAHQKINKGDVIRITASVKGESEYKGQPQTELTRVKVVERTVAAKTWEEIKAEREAQKAQKAQEQLDSLQGEDFAWRMPYKQYKEHYNDCETVEGSFEKNRFGSFITVIVREGRLKASGVRGEHYSGYEFYFMQDGKKHRTCYRAVKEENALRRLQKDFPDATDIQPGRIYNYGI